MPTSIAFYRATGSRDVERGGKLGYAKSAGRMLINPVFELLDALFTSIVCIFSSVFSVFGVFNVFDLIVLFY